MKDLRLNTVSADARCGVQRRCYLVAHDVCGTARCVAEVVA